MIIKPESRKPREPRIRFRPKFDKIVDLLLYLAHRKPGADQYQAVKFFYLADREHFNRFGRPITFESYFALDYGPVASTALDLIKGRPAVLKEAGIATLPIEMKKRDNIITLEVPLRDVNYDLFSKSDLHVFDSVLKEHGQKSFGELYKLTHSHFAYDIAWRSRGSKLSAPMFYEDMIEEGPRKAALIENLEGISESIS